MKKNLLTEIILLVITLGISIGLYHLIYGINLHCDNYIDLITFELRRAIIILEIATLFFLPLYISINVLRLFYHKFLQLYLAFEILTASVLLAGLLFYKYLFLSSDSVVMVDEGWTIYPPLSGVSTLDEHDPVKLQTEQNLLLIIIAAVLLLSFVLTFVSFRQKKRSTHDNK